MSKGKMTRLEKWMFASGDIYGGGAQSLLAVLYLVFLTNVLHLSPGWAGTVVLISKGWDAVADPLMGVISDNTRTRIGRRRPYLLAGGFLTFLAFAMIWYPVAFGSEAGKFVFVTATYLFYNTVSTVVGVPYSSMSTEITPDFDECNRVNIMRLVFSLISTAVCTLLPTILFKSLTSGSLTLWQFYTVLVVGFGTVFAVPLILIGFFGHERVPYDSKPASFSLRNFIKPFRVRAFRKLLVLYLSQAVTLDIVSAVVIYFTLYVVVGMDSTVFLGTFLGIQLLMFPIINGIVGRVSKTKIYRFGLPLAIAGSLGIAFYPSSLPVWGIYLVTGLTALGFAGAQTMNWLIFPDVVDIGEMGLGERITGSFSGVMTFCRKASSALAIFLVGIVLSATGFITPTNAVSHPIEPLASIFGIRAFIFFPFAALMGYAWFVARRFRLTPQVSQRVKYFNEKLREMRLNSPNEGEVQESEKPAVRLDSLNEEEKQEYERLNKEFV